MFSRPIRTLEILKLKPRKPKKHSSKRSSLYNNHRDPFTKLKMLRAWRYWRSTSILMSSNSWGGGKALMMSPKELIHKPSPLKKRGETYRNRQAIWVAQNKGNNLMSLLMLCGTTRCCVQTFSKRNISLRQVAPRLQDEIVPLTGSCMAIAMSWDVWEAKFTPSHRTNSWR